jgi:uncharacterized membrane protein YfcA
VAEILIGAAGILAGTFLGARLLRRIPEEIFRRLVSAIIVVLGIYMLIHGVLDWIASTLARDH